MKKFNISIDTKRFFEAEISNERMGGISPSTLESALDSLEQGYIPFDKCNIEKVEKEVSNLIDEHGEYENLITLLNI